MTPSQIRTLAGRLPEAERREAKKRILLCQRAGWTVLGLWECLKNYGSSQWDLVGIDPAGEFDFLPKLADLSK